MAKQGALSALAGGGLSELWARLRFLFMAIIVYRIEMCIRDSPQGASVQLRLPRAGVVRLWGLAAWNLRSKCKTNKSVFG